MLSISFENVFGLIGLSSLIYLILIYLIKPKPRTLYIPSLMFIMRYRGQSVIRSFFRTLIQNFLFILQFLALLALALIITQPYTMIEKDVSSKNTVFVIDVSASMQAKDAGNGIGDGVIDNVISNNPTRFDKAITKVKEILGTKNTIILAKSVPVVAFEKANRQDTLDYLNTLKATESGSALGESILLAGQILGDDEGRIIVLSDFINTRGISPTTAKVVLQTKNKVVDFINVAEKKELKNIGFVDLNIDDDSTTLFIKNFNKEQKAVKLKIGNDEKSITIAANSIEQYSFKTIHGASDTSYVEAKILDKDDFMADNIVYLASPAIKKIKVLFITNAEIKDEKKFYLKNALSAIKDLELTLNEPPIISKDRFDVYLFYDIIKDQILPGTLEGIIENLKQGSTAIIHVQNNIDKINYKGLLPVEILGRANNSFLAIDQLTEFTKDLDFGFARDYVKAKKLSNAVSIVSAGNGTDSLIASMAIGEGRVVYYGIEDESSDFKFTPYYPIFWNNLLHSMVESEQLKDINLKTDSTLILKKTKTIEKPNGKDIVANALLVDLAGIYNIGKGEDKKIVAANLLNELESDVSLREDVGSSLNEFKFEIVREKQKLNLEWWLVIGAITLLTIEFLYIKFRGDI